MGLERNTQLDLTIPDSVREHMAASTSKKDWENRELAVRRANGGYPTFWEEEIEQSGLRYITMDKWSS